MPNNSPQLEDHFVIERTIVQLEQLEGMIDSGHHLQWAIWKHAEYYALLTFEIDALSSQDWI
jgi:hypothetical protein